MGIDEPSEFELLLGELERAAGELGSFGSEGTTAMLASLADASSGSEFAGPREPTAITVDAADKAEAQVSDEVQALREAPPSLVDLRALTTGQPLSHVITQPLDRTSTPEIGSVIDQKYEVVRLAHDSSRGWVVRHVVLRQQFHLQLLARSIVEDPVMWPRFQRDIRTAGMLGHEHIEYVTDLGRCDQHGAYIVKQWIEGPTLDEWLRESGARPPREAVSFAHSIGEALAALHEIGIIHGRLSGTSLRRMETDDGAVWKLLDVCIPGYDEILLAPEQQRGEATGPEADQYALAYLTWKLLVGADGTLDDRPAIPAELEEALRIALEEVPQQRWPDVDAFIAQLSLALPTQPTPVIHPFDRREASRVIEQEEAAAAADEEPEKQRRQSAFDERPRSMAIEILVGELPGVRVEFNSGARLRRAYRRNMLAGGLFVPTSKELPVGERVRVDLVFKPRAMTVNIEGLVVTHDPGSATRPCGFGVAFDVQARRKLEQFVRSLNLGLGIAPTDRLVTFRELDVHADIDPGAAFLLSRVERQMTVGAARAMFSGLPYDFDECLSRLIEEGYLAVQPATPDTSTPPRAGSRSPATPRPSPRASKAPAQDEPPPRPPTQRGTRRPRALRDHEWSDVARVLESVQYFEEQGNFMAAGRVLESATKNAPHVAAFHHRLALLRARFEMNLDTARDAIAQARALAPDNDEYAGAERYIATLIEIAAVRVVWERQLEGKVRWVRSEPALNRAWFEERTPQEVVLHAVDLSSGFAERTARGPQWKIVFENDPEFDALERRKPTPVRSARERRERQVELARRFGGYAPHFAREPGVARTSNSTLVATADDGLRVKRGDVELSLLSRRPVHGVKFAPNEQTIAWVEERGSGWVLNVAPITGPGTVRARLEGRPAFIWMDDSAALVVLDPKTNEILWVDRRLGDPRVLVTLRPSVNVLMIPAVNDDSMVVIGRQVVGQTRWYGRWLDMRSGESLGEFLVPDGATAGVLRADGKLALALNGGALLVADLKRRAMKTVSTCSPISASVARARWANGTPLLVAEGTEKGARLLSIDVDLLCR